MSTDLTECFVAPVLWKHIKPLRATLVERPSVGTLAVPADICRQIDSALETMLKVSLGLGREVSRVRVYCLVDDQRHLVLGVADNGPTYDVRSQILLSEVGERAHKLGGVLRLGDLLLDGEMAVELSIPLPSN